MPQLPPSPTTGLRRPPLPVWALGLALAMLAPDIARAHNPLPTNGTQYGLRSLSLGQPRFADPDLYNAYDQIGDPLGLLEREKARTKVEVRWRNASLASPG